MRKLACILTVMLLLTITPLTTYASSARVITIAPTLYFDNSTAYCSVMLNANYTDDVIRAVIRLCYEGERIDVWYATSESILVFEKAVDISDYGPGTYEITVDYSINGVQDPRISMTREYLGG